MGFFSKKETSIKRTKQCSRCKLFIDCNNPNLEGFINPNSKILFIGDIPSKRSQSAGKCINGVLEKILIDALNNIGIDFYTECSYVPVLGCHIADIDKNANRINRAIKYCYPGIQHVLMKSNPKVIVSLGKHATKSFLKKYWERDFGKFRRWRGFHIPIREYKAWLVPLYSPKTLAQNIDAEFGKQRNMFLTNKVILENDLLLVKSLLDQEFPEYENELKYCHVLTEKEGLSYLDNLIQRNPKFLAFDYETTGLKPYNKDHKIYSVSFCYEDNRAVAFRWTDKVKELTKPILENESIKKIASNMKYENVWSDIISDIDVQGWFWDTMLMAHVMDSRSEITSLKFQAFVNMGVLDYESSIKQYLRADSSNGLNNIFNCDELNMLKYNAMDSLLEYRLAFLQMKKVGILK